MSASSAATLLTTRDLLAMPDDGVERDLIRGELREKPMTRRSRLHARTEARVAHLLSSWLQNQPEPRGEVLSGEVGCTLRRDPDTTVGIDVAYISAQMTARHVRQELTADPHLPGFRAAVHDLFQ